ncbi:Uncharacterized protein TCAP_02621 [Tolypocladium capitatum]|uniref:CFEM domain-containing protein n=1 Tax=Tolypocladium capitatum TaxID=45235 RepID=A0A2K3QIS8_9HYPO|nr:Uncharacterized protein TCAP_02621 [Tolypocladium capitatum]
MPGVPVVLDTTCTNDFDRPSNSPGSSLPLPGFTTPTPTTMMSWKWFLSAALVALPPVMAQSSSSSISSLAKLPQCALSCLFKELPKTKCPVTDQTCICTDPTLQQYMTTCIISRCTIKQVLTTRNLTATTCNEPIRDKSPEYVAISNAFCTASVLLVAQRLGYKMWAKLGFGPDDWFTLIATLSAVPITIFSAQVLSANGMGRDTWTLPFDQITTFGRYYYVIEVVYFVDVALLKLALLFFYLRIFPTLHVRRLLWGTIAFVSLFGVAFVFAVAFQCTPIGYFWVSWDGEHEGKCLDENAMGLSNAILSIVLDFWMLAIPMWQLKNLGMDWRRKAGIAAMFCVGTFITVVSILRLRALVKFNSDTPNPTWDSFDVTIWSIVEINVGLLCVCLPSLRLLLARLFQRAPVTTQPPHLGYNSAGKMNRSASGRQSWPEHTPNQIIYQTTYTVEYSDKDNYV